MRDIVVVVCGGVGVTQISDQYQNVPSGVEVSPSGNYLALCSWGTAERVPGQEQLQLLQLPSEPPADPAAVSIPIAIMTPGSIFSCSVADDTFGGAHLIGGGKAVHANQMGNGGALFYSHYNPSHAAKTKTAGSTAHTSTSGGHGHASWTSWSMAQGVRVGSADPATAMDSPVVDYGLIEEINNLTTVGWRAGPNTARFGTCCATATSPRSTRTQSRDVTLRFTFVSAARKISRWIHFIHVSSCIILHEQVI